MVYYQSLLAPLLQLKVFRMQNLVQDVVVPLLFLKSGVRPILVLHFCFLFFPLIILFHCHLHHPSRLPVSRSRLLSSHLSCGLSLLLLPSTRSTRCVNQKASGLLGNPANKPTAGRQVLLPPGAGEHGLCCTLQTEDTQCHAAGQDQVSDTATVNWSVIIKQQLIVADSLHQRQLLLM